MKKTSRVTRTYPVPEKQYGGQSTMPPVGVAAAESRRTCEGGVAPTRHVIQHTLHWNRVSDAGRYAIFSYRVTHGS